MRLFIDVGTNSEIVLGSSARALATAAPAGPAFEAAQIRCGMRAADGAIEGVKIVDGEVELTVIGDVEPVGLCGSGLVDAVAELVGAGILDHSGRFVLGSSEHLGKIGEENVFYLSDDIFLSQRDVRELQFAKASIATGWQILCNDMGVDPTEISQVLLGGSFGSYLTAASAVKIGLVPKLALARIVSAGNVAGEGAKIAALSVTERAAASAVLDEVDYVELSGRTDFNDLFIDQLSVPRSDARSSSPAARSRSTSTRSRSAAAGTSRCGRCRPSCTTGPRGSARPSTRRRETSSPTPTAAHAARSTTCRVCRAPTATSSSAGWSTRPARTT